MAGRKLVLSKIDEVKRLKKLGLSKRKIARALKISRNTVKKYLDDNGVIDTESSSVPQTSVKNIDWDSIQKEVQNGVTLQVLWEEYFEGKKIHIQYPGFWKQFKKRFPENSVTMHRIFKPGERAEIDYCDGIEILDPISGEIKSTQLFMGVLCHSRYIFAEFTYTQKSEDFLTSHVNMFNTWGGVSQIISPDNLKSAINRAHKYDPEVNRAYSRLAAHYDIGVVPARVRIG